MRRVLDLLDGAELWADELDAGVASRRQRAGGERYRQSRHAHDLAALASLETLEATAVARRRPATAAAPPYARGCWATRRCAHRRWSAAPRRRWGAGRHAPGGAEGHGGAAAGSRRRWRWWGAAARARCQRAGGGRGARGEGARGDHGDHGAHSPHDRVLRAARRA